MKDKVGGNVRHACAQSVPVRERFFPRQREAKGSTGHSQEPRGDSSSSSSSRGLLLRNPSRNPPSPKPDFSLHRSPWNQTPRPACAQQSLGSRSEISIQMPPPFLSPSEKVVLLEAAASLPLESDHLVLGIPVWYFLAV